MGSRGIPPCQNQRKQEEKRRKGEEVDGAGKLNWGQIIEAL